MIACIALLAGGRATADLVAHYPMNEGSGHTANDVSGHENHGRMNGAEWVTGSYGTALHFDGFDGDDVNCGRDVSLGIEGTGSIIVWFMPQSSPQGGLVCWGHAGGGWEDQRFVTMLNNYPGYAEFGVYLADGEDFYRPYRAPFPPLDEWTQLAVTFTPRSLHVYVDGVLVRAGFQGTKPEITGFDLLIGKADGWGRYGYFLGLIDEVRIYNHSLSEEEVYELYKAEAGNRGKDISGLNTIQVTPIAYPKPGTIVADLDYRGLAPTPPGMTIRADLLDERGAVVAVGAVRMPPVWGEARVVFDVRDLIPNSYTVRAAAFDGLRQIGTTGGADADWPGRALGWEGVTVLNNFCWEILNRVPGKEPPPFYKFNNPREGWAYFSTRATGSIALSVPGATPATIHDPTSGVNQEAMRWLDKGSQTIHISGAGSLDKLIIRSVPTLMYSRWPIMKFGLQTVARPEYIIDHVLPHANSIICHGRTSYTDEWVTQIGGRWYEYIPKIYADADGTAEGIYAYLTATQGMTDPQFSGIIVDEFEPGDEFGAISGQPTYYDAWTEACRRIFDDPQYDGHMIIPYDGLNVWDYEKSTVFLQTIVKGGSWIAWEWYFPEQENESTAWVSINHSLKSDRENLERIIPGVTEQLHIVLSYMTELSLENSDSQADMKVLMDMQFQQLATEPEFFGVAGLGEWVSHHSDEETIRWAARLYRHYALEGNTERLSRDPYALTHLRNGDFISGTDGWTLGPAELDSMDVRGVKGYGILQQRRSHTHGTIQPGLRTRRSNIAPNRFSQTITGLEPGRLYSMRLITGDYQDLINGISRETKHTVSIDLAGVALLDAPEYSLQHIGSWFGYGPFTLERPYYMNLHWRVFRALDTTATLTITDWQDEDTPGGPIGQELIHNHIEVQPYFRATPIETPVDALTPR